VEYVEKAAEMTFVQKMHKVDEIDGRRIESREKM